MKTFDSLMKDLNEEKGTKMVFNIDKFKRALENPPPGILNCQILFYLCFNTPPNGIIPSLGKIANDLKIEIKKVREEISRLKYYGALEG